MRITTCYTVKLKAQYQTFRQGRTRRILDKKPIDNSLMEETTSICLLALRDCVDIVSKEWSQVSTTKGILSKRRLIDTLIHTTKNNQAKYPDFDIQYPNLPTYVRRAVISRAIGIVSSYQSNHRNWSKLSPDVRGDEPTLGIPDHYELTFYEQERDMSCLEKGVLGLKLYDGKVWDWYHFHINPSDAKYLHRIGKTRKLLSPVIEKNCGRYQVRFSFEEERELADPDPFKHLIMAVDLGINAAASWCIMDHTGTVFGKGVIHLSNEEDQLSHAINRKRQYQQAGKKSHCVYRWVRNANERLSVNTARAIIDVAVRYSVDCIVFEHLDRRGRKSRGRYRERIHMWRANDVQKRVELQAHRLGMRISRVCAWNTSRLAYDGSGKIVRGRDAGFDTYSLCRFPSGKIYNCDLSAAQNIGARYFLRALRKDINALDIPAQPQCTLYTLRTRMAA